MSSVPFREIELLSASLDGELAPRDVARLAARMKSEPELAAIATDLKLARGLLRRAPKRRAPRNFTLRLGMRGVRAPTPRSVPVFSWASAVAAVIFIFTLGGSLLRPLGFAGMVPMMAMEAPAGMGGAESASNAADEGLKQAPPATEGLNTPTPEAMLMMVPAPAEDTQASEPVTQESGSRAVDAGIGWQFLWLAAAGVLALAALGMRWASQAVFKRRNIKR